MKKIELLINLEKKVLLNSTSGPSRCDGGRTCISYLVN